MIKRLRIKNYKSLKDLDIELEKRNILVGPNMSGKSNFIDCLRFLSQICIGGVKQAFLDRGGFTEVMWKGKDKGPIYFGLTIEEKEGCEKQKIYEYEISIVGSPSGLISIEKEYLAVKVGEKISILIDLKNGHGKVTHMDGSIAFNIDDPSRSALEFSVPGWEGMEIKNYISAWRYYKLSLPAMKQVNAATSQSFLIENGQNFSSWILTLQTKYQESFRSIIQVAKDSLLGIEEILAPPTQFATTYLISREKFLEQPINIWHMSDGEILFLAWLSLIYAPEEFGAPLFCVEEVENHLHPRLLEILFEVLTQRQKELGPQAAQIIVTTHSPYLVDKMKLEDLIVFEKKEGATQYTRPATKPHLKELLEREDIGLGDLWYSGALEG
jgi:predicted ATPase